MKEILKLNPEKVICSTSSRRKPGWRFTAGLKHNTETIAKLARLGPAENGKLMENFIELTKFCIMFDKKTHMIRCQAYNEDRYRCG